MVLALARRGRGALTSGAAMSTRPTPPTIPMKWIVGSIIAFILLYTVVNLRYRKPAPPHQPYQELVKRTTAARLAAGGWRQLPVETQRPVEKPPLSVVAVRRGPAGLGPGLDECFVEKPALLATIDHATAPAEVARGEACRVDFTGSVPDQQLQLGEVQVYQHGSELVLLPLTEHLPGTRLLSRWPDANYRASFATDTLVPGRYQVRVVAHGAALTWTLEVR